MTIGIRYRVFFAMLAATAAVVLCMWLIMQWSIQRGFLRYVNTLDQQRLATLATALVQGHADHGDWTFLSPDPLPWLRQIVRNAPLETPETEASERPRRGMPPEAEHGPRWQAQQSPRFQPFERRVLLLDSERQTLIAPRDNPANIAVEPLRQAGRTIGYLGLAPRPLAYDAYQLQFVRQQRLALALIAVMTLLVSALIALPLAKRLVRPIKTLAAATHRLSSGAYDTRVPATTGDELGQLARDFNTLALTLEKTEQARRQWVADISHELRTPLSVLRGEIEALQDGIRPVSPQSLQSLHGEVLHLNRLVDDLYQLSLSDLGALSYRKTRVNLEELLREALETFQGEFDAKGSSLVFTAATTPQLEVTADAERLDQLFHNLLDNALKYTDPGGTLEVRLEADPQLATIHFLDSGPGVPEADLEKIFDRLYRVEGSRSRATGGAGLGLAICRNIVEAHEGRISARPSPLGGLWITITLPLAKGTP